MGTLAASQTMEVMVKNEWCKGCGICVEFCSKNVLAMGENGVAYIAQPQNCVGCNKCEMYCPDFAIMLRRTDDAAQRPNVAATAR
ncbi:MAG: 4Fe-4S dicluster domain-containing protein [Bacillota bacterium]|nr:4Fe-4S dicluster domain-containing protein [Bacillota bacterium]MDW7682711.1 4Fe-4S dicluster domain-containing protein [Bacillota bacterium]